MRITKSRAVLEVGRDKVCKRYFAAVDSRVELHYYLTLPFGTPRLLDYDDSTIVIERLEPVANILPAQALAILIQRLHDYGVSHRDIHAQNVVLRGDEPLLIDWETAIDRRGFDLEGPSSGVPVPSIHRPIENYQMWVASEHPASILSEWGVDLRQYLKGNIELPAAVDRRKNGR